MVQLAPLIKQLTEMALQAEIETHLAQDLERNRKNGATSKTMKSSSGEFELNVPRDRNGSFEPETPCFRSLGNISSSFIIY